VFGRTLSPESKVLSPDAEEDRKINGRRIEIEQQSNEAAKGNTSLNVSFEKLWE
jgi:hypothetical protein